MTTPSTTARPVIRTPDQRLRVFVSSTLKELAPERKAVRTAIERLAAAPVMFELGARPHPPRDLYRAYLEQSDVFVGLYWEKYGWVAPGESVSGLEDEYNLVPPEMPRLVYIKETSGAREPRLAELLDRIRSDDRASFKYFTSAEELAELLVRDLAVLLAERFDESRGLSASAPATEARAPSPALSPAPSLPAPLTQLFGRDADVEETARHLQRPGVRLLTLLGPGGIGKTRLSIEVARRLEREFRDGAQFVPLAPVDAAPAVANAIAQVLGVRDTGDVPLDEKLAVALRDRQLLLVLDNFEQVLGAAPLVADLLGAAPGLKVLVTSRALLHLSGEHSVDVSPLAVPPDRVSSWDPAETPSPAVALLVERARAVRPDFELTAENIAAVEGIVRHLEGVPLAIELAAARLRLLSPGDLLERLDRSLALLVGGQRDLPPRQQAVRSTIEWSTRLLGEAERDLLWRLGVFAGRFSLEAVEALVEPGTDALAPLEALVDSSLVRQQDRGGRSCFTILATVREYALEQLASAGRLEEMRDRHAGYYLRLAGEQGGRLIGVAQADAVARLTDERDDLRSAIRHLLDARDWTRASELAWAIWPYWWVGGMLGEARSWMQEMLETPHLPERARAIALCFSHATFFWAEPSRTVFDANLESSAIFERLGFPGEAAVPLIAVTMAYSVLPDVERGTASFERSRRLFRDAGNRWGESVLLISAGMLGLAAGDIPLAVERFAESLRIAEELRDDLAATLALHHLGWMSVQAGRPEEAVGYFAEAMRISVRLDHLQGVAWGLEGFLGVAGARGDAERAGVLAGAAEALRERIGVPDKADAVFHGRVIADLSHGQQVREAFEQGRRRGRRMPLQEAIAVGWDVVADAGAASGASAASPGADARTPVEARRP